MHNCETLRRFFNLSHNLPVFIKFFSTAEVIYFRLVWVSLNEGNKTADSLGISTTFKRRCWKFKNNDIMVDAPGQTCNFAQRIYHILFSLLLQLSSLKAKKIIINCDFSLIPLSLKFFSLKFIRRSIIQG
jgi:hypothetical protein